MALLGAAVCGIAGGQVITELPISSPDSHPGYITAGLDGNLWFTESYPTDSIWRMTPSGVSTRFPLHTAGGAPHEIVAGPAHGFGSESGQVIVDP